MTELKCDLSNQTPELHYIVLPLELTRLISLLEGDHSHKSNYPIIYIINIH